MILLDDVIEARKRIEGAIIRTPLIPSTLETDAKKIYLKLENMQVAGSFKVRGALNCMACLSDTEKAKGVIAWSAGNHAQGVAYAAQAHGIPAAICIPSTGSLSKIEATRSYGANVVLCDGSFEDAMQEAMKLKEKHGYSVIHPFDDERVIAGQGTVGLEILEDCQDADMIVTSIGGGGLISGIARVIKTLKPDCQIIGVEAENVSSMKTSLEDGRPTLIPALDTIADGIAVKRPGDITFKYVKEYVDDIVTVSEDEIADAILHLLEKNRSVAEGAGAAAYAALLKGKIDVKDKKVVCVVSGGNIDVEILNRVLDKALVNQGRLLEFSAEIDDRPGSLSKLIADIAELKGNIITVNHERTQFDLNIKRVIVKILVETRNQTHANRIYDILKTRDYVLRLSER